MSNPAVSILICTRNRCAALRETLAAIGGIDVPRDLPTEVIVIDNGSADATRSVVANAGLKNFSVHYELEPMRGQSRARNRGLAASKGQYILFTDDDVRPPWNWIAGMLANLQSGAFDIVAGGVRIAPHLLRSWMTPRDRAWLASTERIDRKRPAEIVGANFAFNRDVLARVPGFDVELGPGALGFGDDSMFGWKLQDAGYRLGSALDVEVEHHFDPSRLTRAAFLDMAHRFGITRGHLLYAWHKRRIDHPRLKASAKLLQLLALRAKRWPWRRREGIDEWEGSLVSEYYTYSQYAQSQQIPEPPPIAELSVQWT